MFVFARIADSNYRSAKFIMRFFEEISNRLLLVNQIPNRKQFQEDFQDPFTEVDRRAVR